MLVLIPLAYGGLFVCSMVVIAPVGVLALALCDWLRVESSTGDLAASAGVCFVLLSLAIFIALRVRRAWRTTGILHVDPLVFAAGCLSWAAFIMVVGLPLRGGMLRP